MTNRRIKMKFTKIIMSVAVLGLMFAQVQAGDTTPVVCVPDAGSSMLLLSIGLGCLATVKRKFLS